MKTRKRRIWVITGIIIVVLLAVGGSLFWSYHDEPQFCSICHIMQPYVDSWESPPLLANIHGENNLVCVDCHPFEFTTSARQGFDYIRGDYEIPLPERQFPKEWCFTCHEHGSYEELVQRTKNYIAEGEEHNPHDPHMAGNEEYECYFCHKMHKEGAEINYCYTCHHEGGLISCADCHSEVGPIPGVGYEQ